MLGKEVNMSENENIQEVVETAEVEVAEPAAQPEKKGRTATIILTIGIVVLAIACIFLAIKLIGTGTKENQGDKSLPQTTVAAATSTETPTTEEQPQPIEKSVFLAPTKGVIGTVNGVEVDGSLYDYYKVQNVSTFDAYGISLTTDVCAYLEQMCFYNAIQNECMKQLADKNNIAVTDEEVKAMRDEIIGSYFTDEKDFADWLTEMGITEQQYTDNLYYNQIGNKLYEECGKSVSVTEEECRALYDDDPSQYDTRKTSHILIKFNQAGDTLTAEEKQTAYNEALAVLAKVKDDPSKFAEIAKSDSDDGSAAAGGVIDYAFTKGDTSLFAEYVAGAWALEGEGSFSPEPVESSAGYHIIRIDEEKKGYDQFAETIKSSLLAERNDARFNEVFTGFVEESTIEQVVDFQFAEKLTF